MINIYSACRDAKELCIFLTHLISEFINNF